MPEIRKPFKYQKRGVEWFVSHAGAGTFARPGARKTAIILRAFAALKQCKVARRALVVCPMRVMTEVWPVEPLEWVGSEWDCISKLKVQPLHGPAKDKDLKTDADIFVINPDGLKWLLPTPLKPYKELLRMPEEERVAHKQEVKDSLRKWQALGIDTFISDECFAGDTIVATPTGGVQIQLLKVGDLVHTYTGPKRVIKTYKRKPIGLLVKVKFSNGKEISCTEDHCFFTETGWLPAKYLKGQRALANSAVSDLQRKVQSNSSQVFKLSFGADLLAILRNEIKTSSTLRKKVARQTVSACDEKIYRATGMEQGNFLARRSQAKDFRSQKEFEFACVEWEERRQWHRNGKSRKVGKTGVTEEFYFQLCNRIGRKAAWLSYLLQSRFWESRNKDCDRSRWQQSQLANKKSAGQKERRNDCEVWVESVTYLKPGSVPFIWNLEVEECPHFEVAGVAIVHNSTVFKNRGTKRFALLKNVLGTFERRWILTGTPTPRSYENLFSQIYIIDLGAALGQYITHYRLKYFTPLDREGWRWALKTMMMVDPKTLEPSDAPNAVMMKAEEVIQKKIAPYIFTLEPEDYKEIPVEPNVIRVNLPENVRKIYEKLEADMITELASKKIVTAAGAGAVAAKCAQIANGGLYHMPVELDELEHPGKYVSQKRTWENLHEEKIDAVEEILEELNGSPAIIVYEFQHDLDRLRKRFPDAPYIGRGVTLKQATEIFKNWNTNKYSELLVHAASVAHGLNLQYGRAQDIIWHSMTYDLEVYDQLNARLARSGQKHERIFSHLIVARNTVDEAKLRALRSKDRTQRGFLDALKGYASERKKLRK